MTRKKLPIGIQTLAKIREGNCYYVDKTPFVAQLAEEGSYYFLSRPRRFGKSLFLDTLAQAFRGERALSPGFISNSTGTGTSGIRSSGSALRKGVWKGALS